MSAANYDPDTKAVEREQFLEEVFTSKPKNTGSNLDLTVSRLRTYPGLVSVVSNLIFGVVLFAMVNTSWSAAPQYDQWAYEGEILIKYFGHSLSWSALFAQHNESHLFIARVVALLSAPITGWDIRAEVMLTFLCALLTSIGLHLLILKNLALSKSQQICCIIAASAAVLCCVQWEVLLFGAYYFILPGLALVWALVVSGNRWRYQFKVAVWIMLNLLAMLSYTNGVLLWVLLLPTLVFEGRRAHVTTISRRYLQATYCFVGIVSLVFYFATYKHPQHIPSLGKAFAAPFRMLLYYFYWLGAPFSHLGIPSLADGTAGIIFLLLFLAPSAYLFSVHRKNIVAGCFYEWIIVGLYVVLTGLSITVGRSAFGVEEALNSRYQTFSLLLPASFLPLAFLAANRILVDHGAQRLRIFSAYSFVAGALSLLYLLNYYFGAIELTNYGVMRRRAEAAIRFINVIPDNPELLLAYPAIPDILRVARLLAPYHLPHITIGAEQVISSARSINSIGDPSNGFLDGVTDVGNGTVGVSGWAILKERAEPANFVLLEWRGLDGSVKPITVFPASLARPDVAKALNDRRLLDCGFAEVISKSNIPGPGLISAWAVDSEQHKARQLGNTKPIR